MPPSSQTIRPVVLIVGLPDSSNTARWLRMLRGHGFQFILLPAHSGEFRLDAPVRSVATLDALGGVPGDEIAIFDTESVPEHEIAAFDKESSFAAAQFRSPRTVRWSHPAHVAAAIGRLRPAVVHSMDPLFGGQLTLAARRHMQLPFPAWLLSDWNSDLLVFRKLPEHRAALAAMMGFLDGFHAQCPRDIRIARHLGFRGMCWEHTGNMDIGDYPPADLLVQPSRRREIYIDRPCEWRGRGMHLLAAVHLAADALRPYTIRVELEHPGARDTVAAIAECDGLNIDRVSPPQNRQERIERISNARIVVEAETGDRLSMTLLHAMGCAAFPVRACDVAPAPHARLDGCASEEWIASGRTGMRIWVHDVHAMAQALSRAANDDALVDGAARLNRAAVETRWGSNAGASLAAADYRALIARHDARAAARAIHPASHPYV